MGNICSGRTIGHYNCINNSKLPGDKSSDCKPGEEFENGMINVNREWSIVNKTYNLILTI